MPATQHDASLWVAGGEPTAVFDNGRAVVRGSGRSPGCAGRPAAGPTATTAT